MDKCNNGNGRNALFLDVQSYARGHPEVNSHLSGLDGMFSQYKIAKGKMKMTVNVVFSNGDVFKLNLVIALSGVGFELIEVTDQNGNTLTTTSSISSNGSSSGGSGSGGYSIFMYSSGSGGTVSIKTCAYDVCVTSTVQV